MKRSELEVGNIYSEGTRKYRKLTAIEFNESDGNYYAHYQQVGCLLIRDKIYFMTKAKCRVTTFAQWALYGYSEETFIDCRRKEQSA